MTDAAGPCSQLVALAHRESSISYTVTLSGGIYADGSDIYVNGPSVFSNNSAYNGGKAHVQPKSATSKHSQTFFNDCHREPTGTRSDSNVFDCGPFALAEYCTMTIGHRKD